MVTYSEEELEIFKKKYEVEDYDSITKIFKLLGSDYKKFLEVTVKKNVENRPKTDNNLYTLFNKYSFANVLISKIKSDDLNTEFKPISPQNAILPYFTYLGVCNNEFNGPKEDFYIVYLFDKDINKVFLTLELGSTNSYTFEYLKQFSGNELNGVRDKFREKIEEYRSSILDTFDIDLNKFMDDIDLGKLDNSHKTQNQQARDYEDGAIFVKSYDIDELPSEEELIQDLNDFIILYDYILSELRNKKTTESDDLNFDEALKTIHDLLKKHGTNIECKNYDGVIVKKITSNDGPKEGRHIALLKPHEDMFPCLESNGYLKNNELNKTLKKYFTIKIPVTIRKSNLCYLNDKEFNSNDDKIFHSHSTILRSKTSSRNQLEIAHPSLDGEKFNILCKLLDTDYYLIILKINKKLDYEAYGILPDEKDVLEDLAGKFYYKKNVATVISTEQLLDEDYTMNHDRVTSAKNILLYGVPGCGKSWTIQKEYCDDESRMERVIFHPDYSYSDFIGQILPKVSGEQVTYPFIPGPFTKILKKAYANPHNEYFLIIEEINRGNAPAIFGDIFQLLDRKNENNGTAYPIGTSEYGITNYNIAKEIYGEEYEDHKIRIPSNLSIIATMNTSDQNVFSLDTAFQRRWEMKMIENKFKDEDDELKSQKILDTDVTWEKFWKEINRKIREKNRMNLSSEDKQMGTHFIQVSDLEYDENENKENPNNETKLLAKAQNRLFAEKILKYLWDDAFKFSHDDIFDVDEDNSLEDIINGFTHFEKNSRFLIFKEDIIRNLNQSEIIKEKVQYYEWKSER